jgi:hypothetical protein
MVLARETSSTHNLDNYEIENERKVIDLKYN